LTKLEGTSPDVPGKEFFRQCRSTALQKKTIRYSPLAVHYSLLAIRQSPSLRLGRSLSLPKFRRLKSALKFFVINYGLKSIAWFAFALPLPIHATGFSQWLVTNFPKRRNSFGDNSEGTATSVPKFCGRAGTQQAK
jgi:hypothetical protein